MKQQSLFSFVSQHVFDIVEARLNHYALVEFVGRLSPSFLWLSVPCKRKKVRILRNFLRHFLTNFWQLRMAFFDFRNYGVFVWL